jgi:hypothetical protein
MKKLALVVTLLTVMAFTSCTDSVALTVTPSTLTQSSTTAPVSDPFDNVPMYKEGMDLLDAYLTNQNQLTEEQVAYLDPMIQEYWDYEDSYLKLVQGKSGETYLQHFSDAEEYLYSETMSGRIRAFKTEDVGIILVGIDQDGDLRITAFTTPYPKYLQLSTISVNYKETQTEGAIKLYDTNDEAMFFFPEEELVRVYQLTKIIAEYEYPIMGTFLGKSQDIDNDSPYFLTQDKDRVYIYDPRKSSDCPMDGVLVAEGVETVEISDWGYDLQGTFYMLDGREVKFTSSIDPATDYLFENGLILSSSVLPITVYETYAK